MVDPGPFQGKLITFEGGDGAGKSTQVSILAKRLERCGCRVVTTREPGGCPFSEELRKHLVLGQPGAIHEATELLLMMAARVEHVRQLIQPSLRQGLWVLCDRFFDSTLAYQGYGRGMDLRFLEMLNGWAMGNLVPHLTLLLAIDPEEGLRRSGGKVKSSDSQGLEIRFEREGDGFHRRVNAGFAELASRNPSRFRTIDAGAPRDTVAEKVWEALTGVFPTIE